MSLDTSQDTAYDPVISVRELSKTYGTGDDELQAVSGVSFDVEPGTVVGLLGPNGAGKTTAIKTMLGLVTPTSGTVQILGEDSTQNSQEAYRHVGAMLEGARNIYWRLTVRENLAFFARLSGTELADVQEQHQRLLEQFDLAESADKPVSALSRGMKQKASLISTLARQPDIAFLDEPTLGLDLESSMELRREIRRLTDHEDMTVMLSSHDMALVEAICDRVIIMHDGEIIADDNVEALVDLFQAQSYRVTAEPSVPDRVERELNQQYGAQNWTRSAKQVRFDVVLPSGNAFYDLMSLLEQADVTLLSVKSLESDLGDVFLELTNDRGASTTEQEGH